MAAYNWQRWETWLLLPFALLFAIVSAPFWWLGRLLGFFKDDEDSSRQEPRDPD